MSSINNVAPGTQLNIDQFCELTDPMNMREIRVQGNELFVYTRSGQMITLQCPDANKANRVFNLVVACAEVTDL